MEVDLVSSRIEGSYAFCLNLPAYEIMSSKKLSREDTKQKLSGNIEKPRTEIVGFLVFQVDQNGHYTRDDGLPDDAHGSPSPTPVSIRVP